MAEGANKAFIEKLQKAAKFDDAEDVILIDGVRVEFKDGFALARSSNTTPVVVLRVEGETPEALERIKKRFGDFLLTEAPLRIIRAPVVIKQPALNFGPKARRKARRQSSGRFRQIIDCIR